MQLTRNQPYLYGYRGFESLPLRQTPPHSGNSLGLGSANCDCEVSVSFDASMIVFSALLPSDIRKGSCDMIRPVTSDDVPALKAVIDANGLFPSDMLDDMISGYFSGEAVNEFWLTVDDGGRVAVACYIPERMTK